MNSIWYYLTAEDMKSWAKNITDEKLFYQLQQQALHRRPMLKVAYLKLKKKYD